MEWGRSVGTEEESNLILSAGSERPFCHLDAEAHVGHTQRNQSGLHLFLYLFGCFRAQLRQCVGSFLCLHLQLYEFLLKFFQCLVAVLDTIQLQFQFVTFRNQFLNCLHVVFLFQIVEFVQTVVDDIQLVWIKIHVFDIAAVHSFHQFLGIRQHFFDLSDSR